MTRIVFMGTPAFSVPILEALIQSNYDVIGVVTQPDRPVGRKKIVTYSPVKKAALNYNIPVLQPEKISGSEEMEKILEWNPDLIVTAAFGQFLPARLLKSPKFGAINVHASLLPKYRGGAPVHYALIKGEKETGISIIYMEKKMDAGDILAQRSLTITKQDDVGTLFERLSIMGRDLLIETIPLLLEGKLNPIPQNEEKITFSPNIKREEEKIDWHKTAEEIDYQVRGMRPWPGAYTILKGNRIKISDVTPLSDSSYREEPGTIAEIQKDSLIVMCGSGTAIEIDNLQPSGKKQMTISAYLSGVGKEVRVGEKFE